MSHEGPKISLAMNVTVCVAIDKPKFILELFLFFSIETKIAIMRRGHFLERFNNQVGVISEPSSAKIRITACNEGRTAIGEIGAGAHPIGSPSVSGSAVEVPLIPFGSVETSR